MAVKAVSKGLEKRQRPSFLKQAIQQWDLQILVIPGIILLLIFSYLPMYGLIMAFQEFHMGDFPGISQWVGLKQFRSLMNDPNFFRTLRNTIVISSLKLTIGFVCPIIFALFLNEIQHLGTKKVIQTISYLPHFISWTVCALMMFDFLS
ncbi:MAG: sugar ABC transporter permease, partial [Oscillospiraceae bacterium]|nr:sugar ABC transporter permease [Oscillospiraceae bacterium]